jgi:hypothetical protein
VTEVKTVGVVGDGLNEGQHRFLESLGQACGFVLQRWRDGAAVDALLLPQARTKDLEFAERSMLPAFVVARSAPNSPLPAQIEFAASPVVPHPLSGRTVDDSGAADTSALPDWLGATTPLAHRGRSCVWGYRDLSGTRQHFVSAQIPDMKPDEALHTWVRVGHWSSFVPLLAFVREVTDGTAWQPPPPLACFMFDDPNLHWRSYGHIDYAQVARHAHKHRYHVSLATIPLDGWFVHRPTAALFRQEHDAISLLMHGNDHVTEELAQPQAQAQRHAMLSQAMQRIERLESRSGVQVSRVMAPPHGACSEDTLRQMAALGFEAASISRGSLSHYNSGAPWVRTIGVQACDVIGGLPVLPRFRLSSACQPSMLLSALLQQPIIAVGHHQDVAAGLSLLQTLADFVNGFGEVRWCSMTQMVRSHYARKWVGSELHLRMHTRHAEVIVPPGVTRLVVHRPWLQNDTASAPLQLTAAPGSSPAVHGNEITRLTAGQLLHIASPAAAPSPGAQAAARRTWRAWPVVRRLLTESRDRLRPALRRS